MPITERWDSKHNYDDGRTRKSTFAFRLGGDFPSRRLRKFPEAATNPSHRHHLDPCPIAHHSFNVVLPSTFQLVSMFMREMPNYDSSSEDEYEEDPNIPVDVNALENDDSCSVGSELSDQSMKHYGLSYDCKPDISEVANLTLNVNYGDLANMACNKGQVTAPAGVLDPTYTANNGQELTWSQLLDGEPSQPFGSEGKQNTNSFIWTQGYDPNATLAGGQLAFPLPFTKPFKATRRPSDTLSLPGLPRRPRPFDALKRFIIRPKATLVNSKDSSCTADTLSCSFRTRYETAS